ncbi:lipid-transfer protein [Frankia sp. CcI49]|uniref:lipid-transfer protein n=1 Tax=unclassified Frankia TaxID=2632575 RepID=UPI0006CA2F68|nr:MULTISPECIES: lipid-transfer protein [unclassified Frankia]KPM56550.1 lipid-transfer protein [Frankia sp. R43]ONH62622.1 lipid-transfer protein [Frankia sp. CcI49]
MSGHSYAGRTAIAGIGATDFSSDSGRSELRLALEACVAALDDAGLPASKVNGLVTFTMDGNPESDLMRGLGINELTSFSRIHFGGGAPCATVQQAALAVEAGVADYVLCYRAFNERSGRRFGSGVGDRPTGTTTEQASFAWTSPYGLLTPASWVAMFATRMMHEHGVTTEDFGRVAVACRRHAATNPLARFHGRPITLADHQASRWIVEPLRLLDCCQETDGGQAILVTTLERARDLRQPPAVIEAAAQGMADDQQMMRSFFRESLVGLPEAATCARQLWETSGLGPDDIAAAVLYDHFTPFVLTQLEEFGFCGRGEAADFIRDGAIELGGRLPVNPHGGQLGEAYLHGMNGVAEGVRQVRGSAVNQVPDADHVLVTGGTGVPTSALVLGRDR